MAEIEPGAGLRSGAQVIPLRRIRTLVVSSDEAYRERAMTVLSQLGPAVFAVASLSEPADVVGLADAERADVVVLDATGCEAAATDLMAVLAVAAPRVGVVVVCHHCCADAQRLGALPKWGWRKDLRDAVRSAVVAGNPLRPAALVAVRPDSARQRVLGPRRAR